MTTTTIDTEAVAAAELLYTIADQFRAEQTLWKSPMIVAELRGHAATVTEAARQTIARQDVIYGEAFAHAAGLVLRKYTGLRRFIEHCTVDHKVKGYMTLDCRDGNHMACRTCDCWCHS